MNINPIFEKYTKNGGEFEVRFGTFTKTFTPGVSKEQFDRIFIFLDSNKKYYNHSIHPQKIEYFGDVRKITEKDKTIINKKSKSKENTLDIKDWSIRVSLSDEKDIGSLPSKNPDFVKDRVRHSFINNKSKTRFDLDIYKNEDNTNLYTLELECLEGCTLENINNDIYLTLQLLQESKKPLSKKQMDEILKYYHNVTKSRKFVGVQPETLSIEKFKKKEKYAITKKLDGKRYLLLFYKGFVYSISSKLQIKWVGYSYKNNKYDGVVLDTEYFKGFYHIFDVVHQDIADLYSRITFAEEIIKNTKALDDSKPLVIKSLIFTSNTSELYKAFIKETKNLDTRLNDGVILVKQETTYKNSCPLKWKPLDMITIDFQIKKKPDYTFELYVSSKSDLELFSSTIVTKEQYKFYEDDSIIEFSFVDSKWIPLKYRFDKLKPNYITIAQDNLNSILCPFNPEQAFNQNVALYNLRRFHNYIKRIYIENYKGKSVLDLAIGKGGDLGKYNSSGFTYIEGYDIDTSSIKEASCRASVMSSKSNSNISVKLHTQDLVKNEVPSSRVKFDLVVSNFAFHYFYNSLDIYIKSVKNNLKQDGHLLLTFFDGSKIKNMKTKTYEIKKINDKQISVWMKDSVLNKPEIEYIVDTEVVIQEFNKNGLVLVEKTDFESYYPNWSRTNNLSQEEKDLSFLNIAMVFKLKN